MLIAAFLPPGLSSLWGEEFFYIHKAGDQYRILSTVNEDVYLNRAFQYRTQIVNRIAVRVLAEREGVGSVEAVFQTAERAQTPVRAQALERPQEMPRQGGQRPPQRGAKVPLGAFQWDKDYESRFERDRLGHITIGGAYFMPVVRNVPVFPGRGLAPGDTWTAEGHEMHDFSGNFGIREPYRIPFTASYRYLGERLWQNEPCPAFEVRYRILTEPPPAKGRAWPLRIRGDSRQIVYWDAERGRERAYTETFRMIFDLSDGTTIEFRGSASAEVVNPEEMNKAGIVDDIKKELEEQGIEGVDVEAGAEGVKITLEDIRFEADSARLLPSERAKLDAIGGILRRYADRDLLVEGHTALAGLAENRGPLSLERAQAVAGYLEGQGVRAPDRIITRGAGADRPVADNRTEAGRARNRRVEITILEN